jgi:DNA-binding MarR family transcriptional regulator
MTRKTSPQTKAAASIQREIVSRVGQAVRRMGAQSVLTSQAVAARFGIHTTDLEVLDLIYMREQASAGELARATGLTSGSVTALIDRLTKAGYVERQSDPDDRRKVMVRIRHDAIEPIKAVYAPMQVKMFELWSTFSVRELEVIADFLGRSTDLAVACAEEIRRHASPSLPKHRSTRSTHASSVAVVSSPGGNGDQVGKLATRERHADISQVARRKKRARAD